MKFYAVILSVLFCFAANRCMVAEQDLSVLAENVPERVVSKPGQQCLELLLADQNFEKGFEGWEGIGSVKTSLRNSALLIEADRGHPFLYRNFQAPEGEVRIRLRLRTETASDCVFSWMTSVSPHWSDDKTTRVPLADDGQWHDYEVPIPARGSLTTLGMELTADVGIWEMESFRLWVYGPHPLVVRKVAPVGENLEYTIENNGERSVTFRFAEQTYTLEREDEIRLIVAPQVRDCFYVYDLRLVPEDDPDMEWTAFHYRPEIACRWYLLPLGPYRFYVTESGNMARIQYPDSKDALAIIAPFVRIESLAPVAGRNAPFFSTETRLPLLEPWELEDADAVADALRVAGEEDNTLRFVSGETRLTVQTVGSEIRVTIDDPRHFEGPVLRMTGDLQTALLAGSEFLGPGDVSSSEIDVILPDSDRFSPPSTRLTMPLMVFHVKKTEQFGEHEIPVETFIAMTWDGAVLSGRNTGAVLSGRSTGIRPTFDVPNRIDMADDMRMSLHGRENIFAVISVNEGNMGDAVRWFLNRRELPDIPPAPRSPEAQNALTLAAFRGPLLGDDGVSWGYGAEPDFPRQPYDSIAATVWRLSGQLPVLIAPPVYGGSPIQNHAYSFLTGRPMELVDLMRDRAESVMAEMRPDGSFLYLTRFPDVETSEPSPGYCARKTLEMMEYARLTGNRRVFQQIERSLEFMTRFSIPRGGRFWETPLHTPDLLTAAHLVALHVRAFEFSRDEKHLEQAQYWALMGLPFVYLRDEHPNMLYATVPMFGASERENPVWLGTSQPWCGCVYAYSIALLGEYDKSVDWRKIARGILHAAEALQWESGPSIGCLPDGFSLETQEPVSWNVNPAPLASLRWLLDSLHDGCAVIHGRSIRVVSPFPAKLTRDGVVVEGAPEGMTFQLLINGSQVVNVQGNKEGRNFVPIK